MPEFCDVSSHGGLERNGYRAKPGTTIVIRLNPGKLGALNLRETIEKYLCAARVPVYYNNKRVGRTYAEAMQTIHELAGEKVYELSPALKKKYDDCFPAVRGKYPKLAVTVIPLDAEENSILPDLSGVIVKYDVCMEQELQWKVKDQNYKLSASVEIEEGIPKIHLLSKNVQGEAFRIDARGKFKSIEWNGLRDNYGLDETNALGEIFDKLSFCPQKEEQLGEVWNPFMGHITLSGGWRAYLNHHHQKRMSLRYDECGCSNLNAIFGCVQHLEHPCVYQGIIADENLYLGFPRQENSTVFLLGGEWKPTVRASRSGIVDLPLILLVAICGLLDKYRLIAQGYHIVGLKNWNTVSLLQWREVRNSSVGQWMTQNQEDYTERIIQAFQKRWGHEKCNFDQVGGIDSYGSRQILYMYAMTQLQDNYFMTINYEEGQILTFCEKKKTESEDVYDIFPPMMFCKAASDESRKYICNANEDYRRGITADHPFIIWLLENSVQLKQHFERQFQQIVECLRERGAEQIIQAYSIIREQLGSLSNYYGLNIRSLPQISMDDFWSEKIGEECPF